MKYNMEKSIKLFYDYSSPESFWGDVDYVIEQKEGKNPNYEITEIFETEDEDGEDCIIINYKIK
jgi:hypothetical protein